MRKCSGVAVSTVWDQNAKRLEHLLADRALFGLNDAERDELQQLLSIMPGSDDNSLDLAAADVLLACGGLRIEPMPASLCSSVRERAMQYCSRGGADSGDHEI